MCNVSGKLIAWLDHELSPEEAAEVERHLATCAECRTEVEAYKRVSSALDAYCDETLATNTTPRTNPWMAVAAAAGAAVAVVALFFAWPRPRIAPPMFPALPVAVATPPTVATNVAVVPIRPTRRTHRRPAISHQPARGTDAAATPHDEAYVGSEGPVIQIAIPASDIFPPGAVPEGMHFVADMTIAPDASAEHFRLRPRLMGFERSTTLP